MSYCYVLSENQALDVTVALNSADCPEGLRLLGRVVFRLGYTAPDERAHALVCNRLLAPMAREYWERVRNARLNRGSAEVS